MLKTDQLKIYRNNKCKLIYMATHRHLPLTYLAPNYSKNEGFADGYLYGFCFVLVEAFRQNCKTK